MVLEIILETLCHAEIKVFNHFSPHWLDCCNRIEDYWSEETDRTGLDDRIPR